VTVIMPDIDRKHHTTSGRPGLSAPRSEWHVNRRTLIRNAALLGLSVPTVNALLAACAEAPTSSKPGGGSSQGELQMASPDNPVTWPISDDNPPIEDGLQPEAGPLLIYNYADYLGPQVIKSFEEQYGVEVKVSTFNDTDEMLTKIRTGAVPYDICFPSYDQIARMVTGQLVRPLNHFYLGNLGNVWDVFQSPWYDGEARYSVPYSIYTTGLGWRTDQVSDDIPGMDNPYDILWTPSYAGKVSVIDDWHTCMAQVGLRAGITDVNTADADDLQVIQDNLTELAQAVKPKVNISMYNDLPAGQVGLCQMWSGDVVNAQYYLPDDTSVEVLQYWFPEDGKGLVDNDLMLVLKDGQNPVLAHLFLNHMLDEKTSLKNFGYIGYQPPQKVLDTDRLVADGYLPENLATAAVQESWFDTGYRLLELDVDNDAAWHRIWQQFKAGA
jgi:spermidine/putrescine transport system substrate-binding protein